MATNHVETTFTANTKPFNAEIKSANASLAALRAALALNEAEFKNTGNSADYLQNKQNVLNSMITQSQTKQAALNSKLEEAENYYGKNSVQADRLRAQVLKASTEEEKWQKQLDETTKEIKDQETPLDKLNSTIDEQKTKLSALEKEYVNAILAQGKDSKEVEELEKKIVKENSALVKNEKKLKEATSATESLGTATDETGQQSVFFGNLMADLFSNKIQQVANVLKNVAKEVVNLGEDFTSSMSNVEALSGAAGNQLKQLEETAQALGRSTIFTASEVADAFSYMALAGWDTEEMLDGIDGVLNLAAAGNMDLAKASDMVTDYLTAFGLEAADSAHMVDMLTYAFFLLLPES